MVVRITVHLGECSPADTVVRCEHGAHIFFIALSGQIESWFWRR